MITTICWIAIHQKKGIEFYKKRLCLYDVHINPVAFQIGNLKIYWYGISYIVGFYTAWKIASHLVSRHVWISEKQLESLVTWTVGGVVLGGRLGYCFLYDLSKTLSSPFSVFEVWKGGMSFHGALVGIVLSTFLFAKRYDISFLRLGDLIATTGPFGIIFGRIGNFINQEHWGRPTHLPWRVVFENVDQLPRHPSQIYEAIGEGLIPFLVCYFLYGKFSKYPGKLSGLFLMIYAFARCLIEFFRTPDGYIGFLTMGQAFCLPMVAGGIILFFQSKHSKS